MTMIDRNGITKPIIGTIFVRYDEPKKNNAVDHSIYD